MKTTVITALSISIGTAHSATFAAEPATPPAPSAKPNGLDKHFDRHVSGGKDAKGNADNTIFVIAADNGKIRLFNLKADPLEMRDLAKDPSRAELVARLTARSREAGKALGDDPATSVFWQMHDGKITRPEPKAKTK